MTPEELALRFTFHPASPEQATKYETIRAEALRFATAIAALAPLSPEMTRAINHVDFAVMLANAAIARRS